VVPMLGDKRAILILVLVLCFAVVSFPQVEEVNAQSIIYIKADGSVEGTDKIQRDGDVYTLTGDISSGIKVERNFTVIDGAGYTLQGNGEGKGIDLSTLTPSDPLITNITVKNLRIVNFSSGIYSLINNTFVENVLADCGTGINIMGGSNNLIKNNTFTNNINPISITYSNGSGHVITKNSLINGTFIIIWMAPEPTVDLNYWSDYNAKDADGDGIGDIPYFYGGNQESIFMDYHPLMQPVPVIPEFLSWTILPLFLIATLVVIVARNKIRKKGLE